MPTNFSGSFNALVPRITSDRPCTLKRHFSGCMRQVVGYLDLLALKDPDRLVWCGVKDVQKHCFNYSRLKDGKPTRYSLTMVEKALRALRAKGILSRPHAVELQERRGFVVQSAYVVTPHEALTVKVKNCCRFVGMGKVPGTTWGAAADGDVWFISSKSEILPKVIYEAGRGVVVPAFDKLKELLEKEKGQCIPLVVRNTLTVLWKMRPPAARPKEIHAVEILIKANHRSTRVVRSADFCLNRTIIPGGFVVALLAANFAACGQAVQPLAGCRGFGAVTMVLEEIAQRGG
jgi:hypothetical protein